MEFLGQYSYYYGEYVIIHVFKSMERLTPTVSSNVQYGFW